MKLTAFNKLSAMIYWLLRDHVPVGKIYQFIETMQAAEDTANDAGLHMDKPGFIFSDGHAQRLAETMAKEILDDEQSIEELEEENTRLRSNLASERAEVERLRRAVGYHESVARGLRERLQTRKKRAELAEARVREKIELLHNAQCKVADRDQTILEKDKLIESWRCTNVELQTENMMRQTRLQQIRRIVRKMPLGACHTHESSIRQLLFLADS